MKIRNKIISGDSLGYWLHFGLRWLLLNVYERLVFVVKILTFSIYINKSNNHLQHCYQNQCKC